MRAQDANAALSEGADALGFVVDSPASPRNLTFPEAKRLMKMVRVFSTKVAVTSAGDSRRVLRICSELKPDALQLHYYTPQLIQLLRRKQPATKLILATPVRGISSFQRARESSNHSDAVLADTPNPTGMGGTGKVHDWHLTARIRNAIYPHPLIMAGGLTPKNVRAAIKQVKPFAVDVSSGVEKAVGIKDHGKIKEFVLNAKGSIP
jgi:phosphoribosylanthranilate isomerase